MPNSSQFSVPLLDCSILVDLLFKLFCWAVIKRPQLENGKLLENGSKGGGQGYRFMNGELGGGGGKIKPKQKYFEVFYPWVLKKHVFLIRKKNRLSQLKKHGRSEHFFGSGKTRYNQNCRKHFSILLAARAVDTNESPSVWIPWSRVLTNELLTTGLWVLKVGSAGPFASVAIQGKKKKYPWGKI